VSSGLKKNLTIAEMRDDEGRIITPECRLSYDTLSCGGKQSLMTSVRARVGEYRPFRLEHRNRRAASTAGWSTIPAREHAGGARKAGHADVAIIGRCHGLSWRLSAQTYGRIPTGWSESDPTRDATSGHRGCRPHFAALPERLSILRWHCAIPRSSTDARRAWPESAQTEFSRRWADDPADFVSGRPA